MWMLLCMPLEPNKNLDSTDLFLFILMLLGTLFDDIAPIGQVMRCKGQHGTDKGPAHFHIHRTFQCCFLSYLDVPLSSSAYHQFSDVLAAEAQARKELPRYPCL